MDPIPALAAEESPELYADAAATERAMQKTQAARNLGARVALHRSLVPLDEIDWAAQPRQASFFEECDGFCFA